MFHLDLHRYGRFLRLLFASLTLLAVAGISTVPALAGTLAAKKTPRVAYHDTWRKLWEDHITWTRVVIMGILDELPGTPVYTGRLIQNYTDMEGALTPYYGDEGEVLGDLIQDHLVIAAEMLTAAHNGDTAGFNDAKARWYANGDQIAMQMNSMNPRFWPLDQTRQMWHDHLDATLEEATTHLTGDFAGEVAAYDMVHNLALEMADFISAGVMQQFPDKFGGQMP